MGTPIVLDSSSYQMFFRCPKQLWLNKFAFGQGIVLRSEDHNTFFGTFMHEMVYRALRWELTDPREVTAYWWQESAARVDLFPIDPSNTLAMYRRREYSLLSGGLMELFMKEVLPSLRKKYNVLAIEQECVVELGRVAERPVLWACRPDLILERKRDKAIFNCNIKTTSIYESLISSVEATTQIAFEAEALRNAFPDRDVVGSMVLAFNKGKKQAPLKTDIERGLTSGYRFDSPLVWGWYTEIGEPLEKYVRGAAKYLRPMPLTSGVDPAEYVSLCGPMILGDMEGAKEQVMAVASVIDTLKDVENRANCQNDGAFKRPCQYVDYCYEDNLDPYALRIPNHPIEQKKTIVVVSDGGEEQ